MSAPIQFRTRAPKGLARDATKMHHALAELIRVYQFRDRDRICCYDLSVTQFYAIATLIAKGPLTLNELAAELYLEKSSASRVVDGLVQKGYVDRQSHPEDRRAVQLDATPSARAIHARIESESIAEEQSLIEDFEPEVRQALPALLSRLAVAAAARVSAKGGTCCRV